jgi:type II secretory pathway component PulF
MSAIAYEYRAVDRVGRERRGVARATDREGAYRQVVSLGLTPTSLKAADAGRTRRAGRVSAGELAQFTQELGVFIEARIPLSEALATIAEQETNDRFRRVLTGVASRVQSGRQLSEAMEEHRGVFGDVYLASIRAAELSGTMSRILGLLSEMLERTDEVRRQVRSALLYPAIVVGTLTLAVTFLVTFVVPRFAVMFRARGIDLPLLTRGLMAVGEFARGWWWALIPGACVLGVAARAALRRPAVRAVADRALHRVPVLGELLRGLALARFARVLGVCLSSGIGLIEALVMSGRASGRSLLEADAARMADQVRAGGRLGDVLGACGYVPVFARRMLAAGEQSGEMPRMCETVARQYERQARSLSKNLGTVIEPVLVVLIAGVVLVVALAVFLPMWDMVKLMQ